MLAIAFLLLCSIVIGCGVLGVVGMASDRPADKRMTPHFLYIGTASAVAVAALLYFASVSSVR